VEIALQYVDDITDRIFPFANNIYTREGGTHVTGFKTALFYFRKIAFKVSPFFYSFYLGKLILC